MPYERPNIQRMAGYIFGEQRNDADVIKLNTNENPYPPSPAVQAALSVFDASQLRRYPSPMADQVRRIAAKLHGVDAQNILVTHGGDELLRLAITTFLDPGRTLGTVEPSYSLYPVLAAVQDCPVLDVPLDDDWHPPEDLARQWNAAAAPLAMIVNPHAPSGALLPVSVLARLASEFHGVLLIDEAYVDFADAALTANPAALIRDHDNVLILRSLSKGYSLAGLRFGYGIGAPGLIAPMANKTRDSYNMDAIAQRLAEAALSDQVYARGTWQRVIEARAGLRAKLAALDLHAPVSHANFLLVTVPRAWPLTAGAIYQSLKDRNILVRYFDAARLRDKLRITVGTPQENAALLAALAALRGDNGAPRPG